MRPEQIRSITLYAGPKHACGYLPGRPACSWFVDPALPLTPSLYALLLLAQGFRRSGSFVYRPACPDCTACIPVRIPVELFASRRWAKRNLKKNQDLRLSLHNLGISDNAFALYRKYQRRRHPGGDMDYANSLEGEGFLYCAWMERMTMEWHLNDQLVAVSILDEVPNALSAVYTFFDPDLADRGLGTFAILSAIALARSRGRQWLYLGYWVEESPKMLYKARFQPLECYRDQHWGLLGDFPSI